MLPVYAVGTKVSSAGLLHDKLDFVVCEKGKDQPAHVCSLISIFVTCFLERTIVKHMGESFQD